MMLDLTLGVRAEFETKVWPYDRPQANKCYDARPDPLLAEFETKVWPYDRPQADKCYDARPDPLLADPLLACTW